MNDAFLDRIAAEGITGERLVGFCVAYAKSTKGEIMDLYDDRIEAVHFDVLDVEDFFPGIPKDLADEFINILYSAWESVQEASAAVDDEFIDNFHEPSTRFDANESKSKP